MVGKEPLPKLACICNMYVNSIVINRRTPCFFIYRMFQDQKSSLKVFTHREVCLSMSRNWQSELSHEMKCGKSRECTEVYFHWKMAIRALAGVAYLVGASSCNQKVTGSIPGQGTCLGWQLDIQVAENVRGNQSPSPPFLSL